ncbi:MAG: LysR substrate-binding domain-containing protein [Rikenellaceae bacterium]
MLTDFRLTVFVTVARTLSFTRSAAMLNVSQPAISKHIKELESDFGEALFNRQGNRISLTQKAKEILPLIETILDGYYALCDTISPEENNFEGVLHIGASTTIAQYVLPTILAKFNKTYPNIHLSVVSNNSDQIIKMLQRKEIEIALVEGDNLSQEIHYTQFTTDEIVLVSAKQQNREFSTIDIPKLPLLIREEGSGTLSVILTALRGEGITRKNLNIKMQLGSSEAIIRYLKASDSFSFISILVAQDHISHGELFVNKIKDLKIMRNFRFATLHGQNGRLTNLFQTFCLESL